MPRDNSSSKCDMQQELSIRSRLLLLSGLLMLGLIGTTL
jgi:hypothetical protein